jgi:hypothetical protein
MKRAAAVDTNDAMENKKTKNSRQGRFSEREREVLLDSIFVNKDILFGSFSPSLTSRMKEEVWNTITERINAVSGGQERTVEKLQHKWTDWKSKTKMKALKIKKENKKTGRNEALNDHLTAQEIKILDIIGTVSFDGEEEGIDTFAITTAPSEDACAVTYSLPHTPQDFEHVDTLAQPIGASGVAGFEVPSMYEQSHSDFMANLMTCTSEGLK